MIQLKKILLEVAPLDKEYTYKYPNDTTYVYAYKDGKWWAKNIATGKTFDLSVNYEKYRGSIDKLNQYFKKTDKDLEQDSANKLFRMDNDFLIDTATYEYVKKYSKMGELIVSKTLKQLTYNKLAKIHNGIQDNVFRGFEDISSDMILGNGSIRGGFASNNTSDIKIPNAKLNDTIGNVMGNKVYVANNWKMAANKKPIIFTYFYIKTTQKFGGDYKYFWLPTNWIAI